MAKRPRDIVKVTTDAGSFDKFESIELTTDLLSVAEMSMKLGDDGSWPTIAPLVQPGKVVKLYLNDLLQFTGRFERDEGPTSPSAGSVLQVVARTKLSDAKYASADPKIKFKDTSIKDFIFALFAPLGYGPSDFIMVPNTDVSLETGKTKSGSMPHTDLEPIKADQLKVNPPETVWEAMTRVLKRHHLLAWDRADGRIQIGAPNDSADPTYRLICKRGAASAGNNVLSAKRVKDWSDVASEINVYGGGAKKDITRATNKGLAVDRDVFAVSADGGHFNRRVIIPDDGAKTLDQANARAKRELAARKKAKDGWEFKVDAWTYWDGRGAIPFGVGPTVDIDVDVQGSDGSGRYLLHKLTRTLDASDGATSTITLAAPGTYADL